ncbi:hypothetical protein FRC97_06095 [Paracidovorax citrulli]|nr:hypothetical protein FRC75_19945 [Paracidovorax citrulli]UMT90558.1 hypothetical protein FRC90_22490 [Paracidovorax citrulli]UMT94594.1 hypothetical protein FRC97_06095 [Paracidovorax citrulli]
MHCIYNQCSNRAMPDIALQRIHRTRLLQIWRSAGWPCRDTVEIDLLAAGMLRLVPEPGGHEVLRLTDAGIACLAQARQRSARALSAHDRLAMRFAEQLLSAGRIVWRELSLRAAVEALPQPSPAPLPPLSPAAPGRGAPAGLWDGEEAQDGACLPPPAVARVWRMARPDLFSIRHTSVPAYLQPMVHEVKASRADLLSDLRHAAKREAYQWLCEECYYVFPAGIAEPEEIPEPFGVWVLHGAIESGRFELLRPARHARCPLPFAVWMALCRATPLHSEGEPAQALLGEEGGAPASGMPADVRAEAAAPAPSAAP